jgi:hypothetical protein
VDNIKMDLREIGWGGIDWIVLFQDREQWRALANMVINLQVPYIVGKFLSSCITGGFSRMSRHHEVSYLNIKLPKNVGVMFSYAKSIHIHCPICLHGIVLN